MPSFKTVLTKDQALGPRGTRSPVFDHRSVTEECLPAPRWCASRTPRSRAEEQRDGRSARRSTFRPPLALNLLDVRRGAHAVAAVVDGAVLNAR